MEFAQAVRLSANSVSTAKNTNQKSQARHPGQCELRLIITNKVHVRSVLFIYLFIIIIICFLPTQLRGPNPNARLEKACISSLFSLSHRSGLNSKGSLKYFSDRQVQYNSIRMGVCKRKQKRKSK